MTYLSRPRFVFSGSFQADPPTANNDPEHYRSGTFQSNYQMYGKAPENGWWNPKGSGAFRLKDCVVTKTHPSVPPPDEAKIDKLVGALVSHSSAKAPPKLVDLDPQQQFASMIWGLELTVGLAGDDAAFFSGVFEPAGFADLWKRGPGEGHAPLSASYQSVLTDLRPGPRIDASQLLSDLFRLSPDRLSIRMVVDGVDDDPNSPTFTSGRVVGVVGPQEVGEPRFFVAGRRFNPVRGASDIKANDAVAVLEGQHFAIDLGNSIPTTSPRGGFQPIAPLTLALVEKEGHPNETPPRLPYEDLSAAPPPENARWYLDTGGVIDMDLTEEFARQANERALAVLSNGTPILQEGCEGLWLRADDFVFRLDPGDIAKTTFYATRYGTPYPGARISLKLDPSMMAAPPEAGTPEDIIDFVTPVETDEHGRAVFLFTAGDPGRPRQHIDGQIYGIAYQFSDEQPQPGADSNAALMLSALVFSGYRVPENPNWLAHVRPILRTYSNLYPVMQTFVDLDNYASLVARREILSDILTLPRTDPNHMPVTRDLSEAKRKLLKRWLKNPIYMDLGSPHDLELALQLAVEVEHFVIPAYLTALYSIRPGANPPVAAALREVVHEEMLHMVLAGNILTSIGGKVSVDQPAFVPRYPTSLPGGLRSDLVVGLRRCSIELIRDVFMSIERPAHMDEPVRGVIETGSPALQTGYTVGWFYDQIDHALVDLAEKREIDFGHLDRQIAKWPGDLNFGSLAIHSLDSARAAIATICHQGEGTAQQDPFEDDGRPAHYYRFAEIVNGHRLERVDEDRYEYRGSPIAFNPDGVYPMVDDPYQTMFAEDSRARVLADMFSSTYQGLLQSLQAAWGGSQGGIRQALGLMFSLSFSLGDSSRRRLAVMTA